MNTTLIVASYIAALALGWVIGWRHHVAHLAPSIRRLQDALNEE